MSRYDDHYDYRYRDRERDRDRDRDRDYRDYRDSRGSRRDFRGGGAIDESRIYVGGLSSRTRESDLYDFFYNYYPKRVDMKQGYGFVEFESRRDADDAVRDLDGVRLDDARITVQFARARRSERAMPHRPRGYRIEVTGLDPRTSWQSLKDFSRDAGEVIFTDVFNSGSKHHGCVLTWQLYLAGYFCLIHFRAWLALVQVSGLPWSWSLRFEDTVVWARVLREQLSLMHVSNRKLMLR